MIKKLILILILLMIPLVSALDECQEIETASIGCEIITPVITCSTYDTYNSSRSLITDDGGMTQIGSTGMYNFTFNESTIGVWTILLCSNHTTQITIGITDQANMNSINSTLYNEINAINSSIMTNIDDVEANLLLINTSIMNNVDDTQTMLVSVNSTLYSEVDLLEEDLLSINSSIMNEMTIYSSNLTFIGDSVWGYSGDKNVTNLLAPVDINETAIAQEMFNSNLTLLGYTDNRTTGLFGDILLAMDTAMYWIERLLN